MFKPFDKFIFRCPVFPLNVTETFPNYLPIQNEAIFLASPGLFNAFEKFADNNPGKQQKTALSLLKYQNRMRSRCTPFGLFAGCGIGEVGESSEITINKENGFSSKTRLDMDFLYFLSQAISKADSVRSSLHYYPNSTLYKIVDSYRYVEYSYIDGARKYDLSEIEDNVHLTGILKFCEKGALLTEVQKTLSDAGIEEKSAFEYLNTLIDNQVLISSLELPVTGKDLLTGIIDSLKLSNKASTIKDILAEIKNQLNKIDSKQLGRDKAFYMDLETEIKKLNIEYKKQLLFQTDLLIKPAKATLSKKIFDAVTDCVRKLNQLFPQKENQLLVRFKEDFYARYEEEEIPLVEALDPDIGIGFGNFTPGNVDFHPLVDNIHSGKKTENISPLLSQAEIFLLKKYYDSKAKGSMELSIVNDELKHFKDTEDLKLPSTFSATIEIIRPDTNTEEPLIYLKNTGGSSAANLINRFCYLSPEIETYAAQIVEKENEITGINTVLAEIVHLPESRTGNILLRPALRKYEIPYLAKEAVNDDFKIPISDLLISVKQGKKICLRSRELNKEIIPMLTTAHNFYTHSLPIYHFLCLMQFNEIKSECSFQWGNHLASNKFLPRVVYGNIILSPATWNIKKRELENIPGPENAVFFEKMCAFKEERKIPDIVLLAQGDNKLLIDFTDKPSVKLLYSEIKNKDFVLEEFIFDANNPLIRNGEYYYRNELIIGFFKSN